MSEFEKFNFKTIEDFQAKVGELGVNITLSDDLEPLKKPVKIGNKIAPNSIAILPMEGCDSNPDGSPSELVYRRYKRFSTGGAGLLWWEANAVVVEGRANPLQMMLTNENKGEFAKLIEECKKSAIESLGNDFRSVNVLQLTHSGRYSRPVDVAAPIIAQHDPLLDPRVGISENDRVVTDEYLDNLVDKYVRSALLAKEVGFDGVDIKACHRYLLSEILASHTREGKYGGSFENRSRLLLTIVKEVRKAVGEDFIIACRFNVFDYHPYPYGFGVDKENFEKEDFTEPLQLVKLLCDNGVNLLSNSAGNPYYIYPQVTRPFDQPTIGGNTPNEHPLESIARLFNFTREIQKVARDVPVVGNGYSWLREFIPYIGAANLQDGSCALVGLGRQAFAYPDAPKDLLLNGKLEHNKCCISCSKCTQIMRDHGRTGCVIKDADVYAPLFKEARDNSKKK